MSKFLNIKFLLLFPFFFNFRGYVSHSDLTKEEREKLGIFDSTIRLSVGLENVVDLIEDLDQALKKINN